MWPRLACSTPSTVAVNSRSVWRLRRASDSRVSRCGESARTSTRLSRPGGPARRSSRSSPASPASPRATFAAALAASGLPAVAAYRKASAATQWPAALAVLLQVAGSGALEQIGRLLAPAEPEPGDGEAASR
jgi:hypothetical protein